MSIISVQNLKKYFGSTKAVDGISFEIKKGKIVGFLGPNGAGKTTTINCLLDFYRPTSGEIKIFNEDVTNNTQRINNRIGYLNAERSLYENWSGQEHIDLIRSIHKKNTNEKEYIKRLKFDPSKKVQDLSTGNKQKLGLILALMHEPQLLILDEPTAGLDPILQQEIYNILNEQTERGCTVFLSSHNLAEVEKICDKVIIINNGKIVAEEDIIEIKKKKIYLVEVYFEKEVERNILESEKIDIKKELKNGFRISYKGNIIELIDKLKEYKITDIQITHSPLEEIFLEFYK